MTDCKNKGGKRHAEHGSGEATMYGTEIAVCNGRRREGPICEGCYEYTLAFNEDRLTCPLCKDVTEPGTHHLRFTVRSLTEADA